MASISGSLHQGLRFSSALQSPIVGLSSCRALPAGRPCSPSSTLPPLLQPGLSSLPQLPHRVPRSLASPGDYWPGTWPSSHPVFGAGWQWQPPFLPPRSGEVPACYYYITILFPNATRCSLCLLNVDFFEKQNKNKNKIWRKKTKTKFEEKKQKQKFFVNLNFARIFTKRSPDEELGKLDIQFT